MLINYQQSLNNTIFTSKPVSKSKDVSTKTRLKAPKVLEAREVRNFIDDLQLIAEEKRPYYSEQMVNAKFKPLKLKRFVPKILKLV